MKLIIFLNLFLMSTLAFAQIGENDERDQAPDEVVLTKKGNVKKRRVNRAKLLVDRFARNYATEVEDTVFKFNNLRTKAKKIVELIIPKEEREIMNNILKANGVKSFPEIKFKDGKYYFTSQKRVLHFNTLDAFQRQFWVGKHKFSYSGMHDIRELVIRFERFLRKHKFKETSWMNFLIDEAHAEFFCDKFCLSGVVIGAAVAGGMYPIKSTKEIPEIRKEVRAMGMMKKQVHGRVLKCQEDLKKNIPAVLDKTNIESIAPGKFTSFGIIVELLSNKYEKEEEKLGNHIYKQVTDKKPGNCDDFSEFMVGSLKDAKTTRKLKKVLGGVCLEHREMVACLTQFAGFFKSYQGGRYFGKQPQAFGVPFQ
jgi:hypothetical protein